LNYGATTKDHQKAMIIKHEMLYKQYKLTYK